MNDGVQRSQAHDLAQLLSRIEAEDSAALGTAVRSEACADRRSHVIGLTGAPGVGKSTVTGAIISRLRESGRTVAVLAIDPSSARTGGALLGDRLRMVSSADPGVFIRSMASRGRLGGLTTTAPAAVAALAGAEYDVIIVETVGAGQNEIDVAEIVDTTVVVMAPGMGDDIQALKAGVLEVANLFVINKADRGGAGQTESQLRGVLDAGGTTDPSAWRPSITRTVAVRREGIDELLDALAQHAGWLRQTGEPQRRRDERLEQVLRGAVVRRVIDRLGHDPVTAQVRNLSEKVAAGHMMLTEAADLLLGSFVR